MFQTCVKSAVRKKKLSGKRNVAQNAEQLSVITYIGIGFLIFADDVAEQRESRAIMDEAYRIVRVDEPAWEIIGGGINAYNLQQAGKENLTLLSHQTPLIVI